VISLQKRNTKRPDPRASYWDEVNAPTTSADVVTHPKERAIACKEDSCVLGIPRAGGCAVQSAGNKQA
jgi:hypothetical protein